MRQFVADASHELLTPLAAIRGYTELAQRNAGRGARGCRPCDEPGGVGSERMTHLVEDLLLLARLDPGVRWNVKARRPGAVVLPTWSATPMPPVPSTDGPLEVPEQPVVVPGDDARLYQVVANLLANARVHTPASSSVTLSLQTDDGDAVPGSATTARVSAELQSEVSNGSRAPIRRVPARRAPPVSAWRSCPGRAPTGSIALESVPGRTVFTVRLPQAFAAVPSS